ncbi:MAG TPA: hypothetical protein QGI71_00915 [Dehalococcoidia bacterium]|nr:hypothetical protein [Dehalococcoidia bacterium]
MREFLGESGKKRVFFAHDSLLDREVAFELIRTGGLDDAGRECITREAGAAADGGRVIPETTRFLAPPDCARWTV